MPHTPHTPHTPAGAPHTPGGGASGPPSVPSDLPSDLNFDPAAVIDGEGAGQEALNVRTNFDLKIRC